MWNFSLPNFHTISLLWCGHFSIGFFPPIALKFRPLARNNKCRPSQRRGLTSFVNYCIAVRHAHMRTGKSTRLSIQVPFKVYSVSYVTDFLTFVFPDLEGVLCRAILGLAGDFIEFLST